MPASLGWCGLSARCMFRAPTIDDEARRELDYHGQADVPLSTETAGGVGRQMSASPRERRTGPGQKRCAWTAPRDQTPKLGVESCATNSPTMNGLLSSPCCRTSRVAFLGQTTDVSSTASSGFCDPGHLGAICRI